MKIIFLPRGDNTWELLRDWSDNPALRNDAPESIGLIFQADNQMTNCKLRAPTGPQELEEIAAYMRKLEPTEPTNANP